MNGAVTRCRVAVIPESKLSAYTGLFTVMSELYEVEFVAGTIDTISKCDAAILWDIDESTLSALAGDIATKDTLVIASKYGPPVTVQSGRARFSASAFLDPVFRNQDILEDGIKAFHAVAMQEGDELVCMLDDRPYWLMRRREQVTVSVVALGPEEMDSGETVYAHFNRRRWLQLLPLLHFLKQVNRRTGWMAPPLRACLMFDDPNLHGHTYGHIDLQEIAQHTRDFEYHVSFAMVPFDAWHADSAVVERVKQHRERMSLCMHGNNHSKNELASPLNDVALMQLFAQGIRRIRKFEERTGLSVCRVMVPPYGAFADRAAAPMLSLGYEAVCLSRASLSAWNKSRIWNLGFGYGITELIDGLPVIPRHVMARDHEGSYRLAAFLDQPIIPHGHHQDCAEGLGLVEDVVSRIQRLGAVSWMDMTTMSRSNYLTKREDRLLRVRMMARRVTVPIPEGVSEVILERPWVGHEDPEEELLVDLEGSRSFAKILGRSAVSVPHNSQGTLEVIARPVSPVDFRQVQAPRLDLKIAGRRLLAEARDRLLPLVPRLRGN